MQQKNRLQPFIYLDFSGFTLVGHDQQFANPLFYIDIKLEVFVIEIIK